MADQANSQSEALVDEPDRTRCGTGSTRALGLPGVRSRRCQSERPGLVSRVTSCSCLTPTSSTGRSCNDGHQTPNFSGFDSAAWEQVSEMAKDLADVITNGRAPTLIGLQKDLEAVASRRSGSLATPMEVESGARRRDWAPLYATTGQVFYIHICARGYQYDDTTSSSASSSVFSESEEEEEDGPQDDSREQFLALGEDDDLDPDQQMVNDQRNADLAHTDLLQQLGVPQTGRSRTPCTSSSTAMSNSDDIDTSSPAMSGEGSHLEGLTSTTVNSAQTSSASRQCP
ncbi:unnamed protein product [Amoebophrya sp. A25]|nr:unnamed protein product [Amoebophrya sp. A25]|eukprot:GSA25T00007680001.1